ncbi:MAG: efflux transporter outer membrane subunit [Thiobacillus sp.]|uniref:efflux transporter outer membrane subunit n=1 Tax=Thiobacillus sp. TaxID=924 RepID=UPI00168C4C8D|nr:efflux transporter outer membrane subunit [Thiobacillus sp.]QLQ02634.1 MAG: efflux transporter outer membrane subunit [Thiobacillus sp.]
MPKHLPLTLALATSLLGGCSFMPDYFRPTAPIPAQWPETARAEGARLAEKLDWQDYFPDERLQTLIAAALEHNRDMRIAVARVDEARALYGIQRADRLPTINASASENASRSPGDLLPGDSTVSRRYDVNLGMLAFELDFWGRVASLSEAARASYLATEEAQHAFRLSLIASVADGYLSLKEAEERAALARQTLDARAETLRLVAKRREVGLAGDLDYLQADGAFQSARAELASLERQRAVAQNFLQALVGTDRSDWPKGRSLTDQGIVPDLAAGLPSEILTRRPDVLAAEQRLMAANANIGAARAAFLPRISLTAAAGTASRALSGLFEGGSGAWSFQPTISLPLFDFGRTSANLDLASARKVIAVAEYENAIQQAFREVADLLAAREKLAEQLAAQEAFEETQRQRLVLAEARYSNGIASFLEVLDAQREEFSARQGVIQTRRNLLSVAAQLYKALGGGTQLEAAKS